MTTNRSQGGKRVAASTKGVSSARLHQKSGSANAYGGYTKVHNPSGSFRMRPSSK